MQLPGPVRAVVGLAAGVADGARHLPERAVEFPVLALSTALQVSLRAQQRYARLTMRGDQVLARMTGDTPSEAPPPWATFDDDPRAAFGRESADAARLIDELLGPAAADPDSPEAADAPAVVPITAARRKPAATRTAPPAAARAGRGGDGAAAAAAAKSTTPKRTKKTTASTTAEKPARPRKAAKATSADTAAEPRSRPKAVSPPRSGRGSKFDQAGD